MSNYEITKHQITGDVLWKIEDTDLAITDGGLRIVKEFIEKNNYNDYTLSIFDEMTGNTIEIDTDIKEMPTIVSRIYMEEHATPLSFIGLNKLTKSYVVGMNITKGRIEFGNYIFKNNELKKYSREI